MRNEPPRTRDRCRTSSTASNAGPSLTSEFSNSRCLSTDPSRFRISIVHWPWIWIPSPVPLGAFAALAVSELADGCAAFASAALGAVPAFDCAKLLAARPALPREGRPAPIPARQFVKLICLCRSFSCCVSPSHVVEAVSSLKAKFLGELVARKQIYFSALPPGRRETER